MEAKANATGFEEDDMFAEAEIGEADEFMSIKPWKGSMVAPSSFTREPVN